MFVATRTHLGLDLAWKSDCTDVCAWLMPMKVTKCLKNKEWWILVHKCISQKILKDLLHSCFFIFLCLSNLQHSQVRLRCRSIRLQHGLLAAEAGSQPKEKIQRNSEKIMCAAVRIMLLSISERFGTILRRTCDSYVTTSCGSSVYLRDSQGWPVTGRSKIGGGPWTDGA